MTSITSLAAKAVLPKVVNSFSSSYRRWYGIERDWGKVYVCPIVSYSVRYKKVYRIIGVRRIFVQPVQTIPYPSLHIQQHLLFLYNKNTHTIKTYNTYHKDSAEVTMVSRYHEQGPYKVFVTEGATHVDPNKEGHGHSNEATNPMRRMIWKADRNRHAAYTTMCVVPRMIRLRYNVIMKAELWMAMMAL